MFPPDRVLVVHVQRTAGTSLRRALEATCEAGGVYPSATVLASRPDGRYESAAELLERWERVADHRFLFGHFVASFAEVLPVRYRRATFLRDPVARSVSIIEHHSARTGRSVSELLVDNAFLETHVANLQTRVFGTEPFMRAGALTTARPQEAPAADRATLERALERLGEFEFVGLTDRLDESVTRFDSIFRTTARSALQRHNASASGDVSRVDIARVVTPLVQLDSELVARAFP